LSYRGLIARRARYLLTALGTMVGVAGLFSVLVTAGVMSRALRDTVHGGAGHADVVIGPVGAYDATLPAGLEAQVAQLPGVERATPSLGIRSLLQPNLAPPAPGTPPNFTQDQIVFLHGVEMPSYTQVHPFTLTAGRPFNPGAQEMIVSRSLASRMNLRVGQTVAMASPSGASQLSIVGVIEERGAGQADNGSVAYTSLSAARALYGRADASNDIDVVLSKGTSARSWIDHHRAALGDRVAMQEASQIASGFRSFISAVNAALTLISVIALFVSAFLIFLTFSLAVAERTRLYGTLRALGAVPRQVHRVVVVEAALLGLASSVGGIALGYGLAAASVGLLGSLLRLTLPSVGLPVGAVVVSLLVGTLVSVVAAWVPARRAAALSPVAAMRFGHQADERRRRVWPRVAVLGLGLALIYGPSPTPIRSLAAILVLLGAVLLVPFLVRPLARCLGPVTRRLAPGVGDIAVMHLVKERSRSAYTLALIMVVLGMILAVGASNVAMNRTLDQVLTRQAGSDLQVVAPGAFEPGVANQLTTIHGVDQLSPVRFGQTDLLDGARVTNTFLTVIDPASYFRLASFAWVQGDSGSARSALLGGHAVLLPDATASAMGVRRGRPVSLRTNRGVEQFTLAGTYAQLGPGFGAVASTTDLFLFGAGRPNGFLVSLKPGADPETVRKAIMGRLGAHQPLLVQTAAMIKAQARAQLRGFFSLAYAMLVLAAATGLLGLANTLVFSVLLRTREIGMLRSSGAVRGQIRGAVLVEAATLALVAFLLAIPLGSLLGAGLISGQRATFGFTVHFTFPWGMVAPVGLIALTIALAASLFPARRAGRIEVVSALRFD
jgi:putative ABC transport system permease protein